MGLGVAMGAQGGSVALSGQAYEYADQALLDGDERSSSDEALSSSDDEDEAPLRLRQLSPPIPSPHARVPTQGVGRTTLKHKRVEEIYAGKPGVKPAPPPGPARRPAVERRSPFVDVDARVLIVGNSRTKQVYVGRYARVVQHLGHGWHRLSLEGSAEAVRSLSQPQEPKPYEVRALVNPENLNPTKVTSVPRLFKPQEARIHSASFILSCRDVP